MNSTEQAILKTIAWFSLFDFPLTDREIHTFLWGGLTVTYRNIVHTLATSSAMKQHLEITEAFYHLKGKTNTVYTRKERYRIAERKFKRALRVTRLIRILPWVRMVAVCNTLGYSNTPDASDIDLFIITSPKRVWLTRFFVVGALRVLKLRPILERFSHKPEERKDKIDASFFIDETVMNLSSISLQGGDVYLAYWIHQCTPLYDAGTYYQQFLNANTWTQTYLPHTFPYYPAYRRRVRPVPRWLQHIGNILTPHRLERMAQYIQQRIMPERLQQLAQNASTDIIITQYMLKFHDQDKREYFRKIWQNKLKQFDIIIKNSLGK